MDATKTVTSHPPFWRKTADFSAALSSTTHQMSPRSGRPSENLRPCSHPKKPKRVFHSTSYLKRSRGKIKITMMKRPRPRQLAAVTTKKRIKQKSALQTKKKEGPQIKWRVLPREATHIKTKGQTDPGKVPLPFYFQIFLFQPNSNISYEHT